MNAAPLLSHRSRCGRAWYLPRAGPIVAGLCLAAASCSGPAPPAAPPAGASPVNSLTVKSCTVDHLAARCGTLIVPEDRLTGKGRTIPVRFVVFPAAGPDRAPDPLVYFAGGPGVSAIADIPAWLSGFMSLNLNRDLVFIEQRGTGQSNLLNCPASSLPLADKAALRASVQSCLARLHGDLRFYTTAMFTDDVSQILTDLHYTTVNLIGGSYGATAEQVFLLRHPDQVRTMTMMNGTLLTIPLYERQPGNSQLALDYVLALCESQPTCHQAFPHLAADWAALWASLGRSPWVVPAAQSPTGKTERLDQDAVADWVYEALHASELAPIPVLVHTLGAATNKAAALVSVYKAAQAAGLTGAGGGATPMMQYEIVCAEPWASDQPAALSDQRGSFDYQNDLNTAQWWQYVCPLIPKSAAAVGSQQLTVSAVPVLAFSGEADPADPSRNTAGAQQFWPNSRDITLPSQGHSVTSASWSCEGALIQTFVAQASAAHLNTSCVAAIPAPAFPLTLQALAGSG
jgi:pimeloyl-ACP methyl ester carboxylesterase